MLAITVTAEAAANDGSGTFDLRFKTVRFGFKLY